MKDINLITESAGNNKYITSIEIMTPVLSLIEAINYSKQIANRCTDILSLISGQGVSCSLDQMNEIGNAVGVPLIGTKTFSIGATFVKPREVNLKKPAFLKIIQGNDQKLARQLSHFRRGISSLDIIEQIREYYQIIEDEYGKKDPRIMQYKYIRHLVSHPELQSTKARNEAIILLGKPYLDPSEPKDISVLSTHLKQLKKEAVQIINSKT